MKTALTTFLLAAVCLASQAQDDTRAHIPHKLPDGTPPPPAPPKPAWVIPSVDVLSENSHDEGGRTITVREVRPIALPEPPQPAAPLVMTDEFKERITEYKEKHPRHQIITLGATVYRLENEVIRTFVQVWNNSGEGPVSFWSSGDFSLLSGIGTFTDNRGESRALFMMWSVHDTTRLSRMMERVGKEYVPPEIPELPNEKAAYLVQKGNPDDDLRVALDSLHEILNHDNAELRRAYEGRQRATKEREEFLKANPPQPQDIILNFWRIEKPAGQEKGESR